jgi:hypothetical protein
VACLCNHCYDQNIIHYIYTDLDLHLTAKNIKVFLGVNMETQQWVHFAVLLTYKIIHTATQIWRFLTDFHEGTTIKFHENPSNGATLIHSDRHDKANRHFSQLMQMNVKWHKM